MTPVRVGVVGAGLMGLLHAAIYRALPDVKLAWVAEPDPDRRRAAAARFGVPAVPDPGGLWAEVDAVSVCTPDDVRQPATDALAAGRYVLCEKPLATSVPAAREILAARAGPDHLTVGHVLRFDPRVERARDVVRSVGTPWSVRCWRENSLASADRIGPRTSVDWFLGIHDVDVVRHVTGRPVGRVRARARTVVSAHRDLVEVQAELDDGTPVDLRWSWLLPAEHPGGLRAGLEVLGADGLLEVDLAHGQVGVAGRATGGQRYLDTHHWPESGGVPGGDLRRELEAFVRTVRGEAPAAVPGEDGLAAVAVIAAVERSLATGTWTDV